MPTNPSIKAARRAHELAKLALETAVMKRRQEIMQVYDATESSTMRRQPVREMSGEDCIYDQRKRVLGTNIGRDLERNYSPARGIVHQFRMNVVGALGKLQVNTTGGEEATEYFNQDWAKDCDYREPGLHFSEVLQNVVASVLREGDMLGIFDDGLIETGPGSGKLLNWEADQIVPLSEQALKAKGYANAVQENGIIRGPWGKVEAYVVTGKRGITVIDDHADATIFKAGDARLVKNPWRLNQGRGVPAMITSATNILDLYEILGKELISAKRATQIAGFVERGDAVDNFDDPSAVPGHLPENGDKSAATTTAEGANSTENTGLNYERFEALTGGIFEYGAKGDKMTFPDINRPNVHLPEFIEAVLGYAGSSLGLARAYTILRADSSYTAFRGDMILTWAGAFYPMQKWLERQYADWVAIRVLTWAQGQKKIKPLPAGWARRLSWQWPTMPHVDEAREEAATENALRNGTTDYSEQLGPGWRVKFGALAEQLALARKLELPLSVFTAKSGGTAMPEETKTPEQIKKEAEENA